MAEITFNATGFSSLKAQIREATLEYQALLQNIEATPEAVAAAASKVADLKDQIDDANDAVNALTGAGKIQAFTKGLSSVAGGFTAIQGAITLAGGGAKEFEQTMLKLQGALALTQGLAALEDLPNAFKNIKTAGVGAFQAIKAAIGATGIGLLVIALGTIVAFWDDIKGAVSGVTSEQKALNKATEDNLAVQTEQLATLNASDNILKEQGLTEREIATLKKKQTEETIKAAEANLANLKVTEKKQIEAAERNKTILQGIIRFLTLPLTGLLMTVDKVGKALGQDFGLEEGFSGGLAKLVFDPEEVKTEGDKAIKEAEKALLALKNQRAGYVNQIKDIDKKAAEDAQKTADDAAEKARKKQEEADKEAAAKLKDSIAKEQKAIKERNESLRKLDEAEAAEGQDAITTKFANNLSRLKEAQAEELKQENLTEEAKLAIVEKFSALIAANEVLRKKETVDLAEKTQKELDAIDDKAKLKLIQDEKDKRDARQKAAEATLNLASSTFSQILDLERTQLQASLSNTALSEEEREKIAKESFEKQKQLQLALALIDSAKTVTSILAQYPKFDGGIAMFAALATTAVTLGFAISKIQGAEYQSPNKTSASPKGSSATPSTYAQGGLLMGNSHDMGGIKTSMGELEGGEFVINKRATANFMPLLEAINTLGNTRGPEVAQSMQTPIIKTYVVATDVTSQQEANVKLNALARL